MDASGENGVRSATKLTVEEAARILGIKEESVRKRVRRGTMRFEKGPDGRLYVYLDGIKAVRDANGRASRGLYGDGSGDEPTDAARKVVEAKDEAIRILQRQLEEEREARRRADTIFAQLTQLNDTLAARVPGLDDSSTEPPDTVGETVTTADGGPMATECGSPWWRKRLGRV